MPTAKTSIAPCNRGDYFRLMSVTLPLAQMSVQEKLEVMEQLWTDLSTREHEVPSPAWHAEILQERERLVASGEALFHDLEEAKRRIDRRLK